MLSDTRSPKNYIMSTGIPIIEKLDTKYNSEFSGCSVSITITCPFQFVVDEMINVFQLDTAVNFVTITRY